MPDDSIFETRKIIACVLNAKPYSETLGFIQPLGEIVDGKLVSLTAANFCSTMKVFITKGYDEIESNYEGRYFEIDIRLSNVLSDKLNPEDACKYVATAQDVSDIKPKDYIEIIKSELPDSNVRRLVLSEPPGTRYIFIDDGERIYGP